MKATKALAFAAALAAFGPASAGVDSYLYWMVAETPTYDANSGKEGPVSYDYAMVSTDGGSTFLTLYGTEGSLETEILDGNTPAYAGFDSTQPFSTFLFRLYDENDSPVGWSTLPYSTAMANGNVFDDPTQGSYAGLYTVSQVVPEPTSGLLLALGGALLALRRRRAA